MGRESIAGDRNDRRSREDILKIQSKARNAAEQGEAEWAGDIAKEQADEARKISTAESGQFKIIDREARSANKLPSKLEQDIAKKKMEQEIQQKKDRETHEEAYPGISLVDDKKISSFKAKFDNNSTAKKTMIERALAAIQGKRKSAEESYEEAVYSVWNRPDVERNAKKIEEATSFSTDKSHLLAAIKATTPGEQALHTEDFLDSLA